jgi:hypothetical protein
MIRRLAAVLTPQRRCSERFLLVRNACKEMTLSCSLRNVLDT